MSRREGKKQREKEKKKYDPWYFQYSGLVSFQCKLRV
jgi:hypothetical protein